MATPRNVKNKNHSGEIEVSGYFSTGFVGEGEEEVPEKKDLEWLVFFVVILLGILFVRSTYLQVAKGAYYQKQAEDNRIKHIVINAPRGIIYDRNHEILASSSPQFDLVMIPGLIPKDEKERNAIFYDVSNVADISQSELENKYISALPESFDPVLLKEALPREEAIRIEADSANWKGIIINKKAKRIYPEKEVVAHILGYTGKINDQELKNKSGYQMTDSIGKEGLEIQYEDLLKGKKGDSQLEVDSSGESKRIIGGTKPTMGNNLVLTLDENIQKEAYSALKEKVEESGGTGGAVVAINPRDGGIISLVNYPSFDDNEFVNGISSQRYSEIMNDGTKPLFNRAVLGAYPPGSTFKPLVAAAALQEKVVTPNEVLMCPAVINVGQWHFEDWKYHGETNLDRAIAESVNTYFYIVGGGWGDKKGLGPENIKKYAQMFGLGNKTGIDLPKEGLGLVPDPTWKEENKKEPWYIGDTYHLSIGQGDLLVTPLQLASYISALVNGGTLYKPHFLDYVEDSGSHQVVEKDKPEILKENILPNNVLNSVKEAMTETISSDSGSGRQLQDLAAKYNIKIGGKTGTAQIGGDERYHAWFVAFAPVENPEIAVAVLVEKGGEGYQSAVPVARRVLDKFFEEKQ